LQLHLTRTGISSDQFRSPVCTQNTLRSVQADKSVMYHQRCAWCSDDEPYQGYTDDEEVSDLDLNSPEEMSDNDNDNDSPPAHHSLGAAHATAATPPQSPTQPSDIQPSDIAAPVAPVPPVETVPVEVAVVEVERPSVPAVPAPPPEPALKAETLSKFARRRPAAKPSAAAAAAAARAAATPVPLRLRPCSHPAAAPARSSNTVQVNDAQGEKHRAATARSSSSV
jgi:hypothetical protein